nr:sensor histidine kinase [Clostridia bacterium]
YISAAEQGGKAVMSFKNVSREKLNISADELMERFVMCDAARTCEGSGLGLNIAKSLAELQGGSLELAIDWDLFRADVTLPKAA